MHSIFKWQKINFQTSQFNHFAFCCKSMTYGGHNVAKVFFFTCPTNPIWVWVQRIPSFFLYYCKQKFYNHFCKAWGFMLQNQGNMPLARPIWQWQCFRKVQLLVPARKNVRFNVFKHPINFFTIFFAFLTSFRPLQNFAYFSIFRLFALPSKQP